MKPLDRTSVRTRDLMIDGQEFRQYHDPFSLVARNLWADISTYTHLDTVPSLEGLNARIPKL